MEDDQYNWCPYKNKRERHTGRMPCDDRGRNCSDADASQGTPWIYGHHQKLGKGKEGILPMNLQKEHVTPENLISSFWSPDL